MAVLVSDLVERARRELYGSSRAMFNQLGTALTDGTTTNVSMTYGLQGITANSYIGIDDELMYVWVANTQALTATGQRGVLGTTPVGHALGSVVEVNPRFSRVGIRQQLRNEIVAWPQTLFSVQTFDVAVAAGARVIDLSSVPVNFVRILDIVASPQQGTDAYTSVRFKYYKTVSNSLYPNGVAELASPAVSGGFSAHVIVGLPFNVTDMSDTVDVEATIGLGDTMLDIPVYGAAWRLESTREIKRTDTLTQGESRIATEVPVGAMSAAARNLKALRDQRINEEIRRLLNFWPWKIA